MVRGFSLDFVFCHGGKSSSQLKSQTKVVQKLVKVGVIPGSKLLSLHKDFSRATTVRTQKETAFQILWTSGLCCGYTKKYSARSRSELGEAEYQGERGIGFISQGLHERWYHIMMPLSVARFTVLQYHSMVAFADSSKQHVLMGCPRARERKFKKTKNRLKRDKCILTWLHARTTLFTRVHRQQIRQAPQ